MCDKIRKKLCCVHDMQVRHVAIKGNNFNKVIQHYHTARFLGLLAGYLQLSTSSEQDKVYVVNNHAAANTVYTV